jgi:GntR family transcriptional regulator of arabinose operon
MKKEKHLYLADRLIDSIKDGRYASGTKLPSQAELCKKYDISRTTVHYAFNVLEEQNLIVRRPGKGIYVRSKPINQDQPQLKNVGVLLYGFPRLTANNQDNFGLEIFWGIESELNRNNIGCQFFRSNENDIGSLLAALPNLNVDALIVDRMFTDDQLKLFRILHLPIVVAGRMSHLQNVCSVAPNITDYYRQFCMRLVEEGYKKIQLLVRKNFFTAEDFYSVFYSLKNNYPGNLFSIASYMPPAADEPGNDDDIPAKIKYLIDSNNLPEVFICCSDWTAIRVMEELKNNQIRVPEEVKVVGCFDLELSAPPPGITTFRVSPYTIGTKSVEILRQMNENRHDSIFEKLPLEYIERGSFQW